MQLTTNSIQKKLVFLTGCLILFIACLRPGFAATAEDFGYKDRRDLRRAMPVLVLRVVERGTTFFESKHSVEYYNNLVFGPSYPNFNSYVREVSRGKMYVYPAVRQVTSTGVVAIKEVPRDPVSTYGERIRTAAIIKASRTVNFDKFDRNGDGRITDDELTVLIVISQPTGVLGAANRGTLPGCIVPGPNGYQNRNNTKEVCLRIGSMSENESFGTMAHEIVHSWGAHDMYDPFCWNRGLTLMSCTGGIVDLVRDAAHLDPWHKMNFGWVKPRIIDVAAPFSCSALRSPISGQWTSPDHEPILLYDSRRGTNEYFLLEHRDPTPTRALRGRGRRSYDMDMNFAPGNLARGLAVWQVRVDDDGNIERDNVGIKPGNNGVFDGFVGGDDRVIASIVFWGANELLQSLPAEDDVLTGSISNHLYSPSGVRAIDSTLRNDATGPFRLRWTDGTDLGIGVQVNTDEMPQSLMDVLVIRDDAGRPRNIDDKAQAACYTRVTGARVINKGVTASETVFHAIKKNGSLVWYKHFGRLNGADNWANFEGEKVLTRRGWNGFKQVISAGDGVLYGIKQNGTLVWYRNTGWERGQRNWANRGGEIVLATGTRPGDGWSQYKTVISGGDGVLYAIKQDGSLVWYRHTGWETGENRWANRGNERVLIRGRGAGSGWSAFKQVISASQGVFYVIKYDGSLAWYRHEGWETGRRLWANGGAERVLSAGSGPRSGWAGFQRVVGANEGVFYPIKADGSLVWYRHLDWNSGGPRWARLGETALSTGNGPGTGWSAFRSVSGMTD